MAKKSVKLKDLVNEFPKDPGVYLMKNPVGKIIYVGKGKNLRNRVRSYFNASGDQSPKTVFLVKQISHVEYIITKTEVEAFLLEASLIKKHRPKYNIRLKDDKNYPYIRLSLADKFPRLYLCRKVVKDGSMYFGPYTNGFVVKETIRFLNETYMVRDCNDGFMRARQRPCMTYEINRCKAPCVKLVGEKEYRKDINGALAFLNGENSKVIKNLEREMKLAAKEERFERAVKVRDSLRALETILEKQSVINANSLENQDAVGFFGDERGTLVATVHVRQGRVIGQRNHFLPQINLSSSKEDVREWLVDFLNQYYYENIVPDEVLLSVEIGQDLTKLLNEVLTKRKDKKVRVRFATDENGRRLIEMAEKNAESQFGLHLTRSENKEKALEYIQKRLHLVRRPRRIECYDISNFQGQESVGSQVVFIDGVPEKDEYRRYKIKTVTGPDDYASIKEVLERRFRHTEYDDPDLVVVDGGKGQLNQVVKVLKEIGRLDIPVVGLAKARTQGEFSDQEVTQTEERFFLPGRQNPVIFARNEDALHILVSLRDEAHRFAISYHRKIRESSLLESELDSIEGLGEKRKDILLKRFDSIEAIRKAEVEKIAALPGFNKKVAERIKKDLNK
ncbi:MAG: excinuclease ABC subunit UvrC [Pseudomonadota bacterium]|nr:excinuclease ABC subunit UvrC [Pseudomonadota bacterium]